MHRRSPRRHRRAGVSVAPGRSSRIGELPATTATRGVADKSAPGSHDSVLAPLPPTSKPNMRPCVSEAAQSSLSSVHSTYQD